MVRKLSSYSFSFTLSVRPRWRCRFGGIGCNRSKAFTESRFSHDDSNNWMRKLKTDVIVRAGDNANHRRSGDLRHRPGGTEFCQTKLARRLTERSTTLARGLKYFWNRRNRAPSAMQSTLAVWAVSHRQMP